MGLAPLGTAGTLPGMWPGSGWAWAQGALEGAGLWHWQLVGKAGREGWPGASLENSCHKPDWEALSMWTRLVVWQGHPGPREEGTAAPRTASEGLWLEANRGRRLAGSAALARPPLAAGHSEGGTQSSCPQTAGISHTDAALRLLVADSGAPVSSRPPFPELSRGSLKSPLKHP